MSEMGQVLQAIMELSNKMDEKFERLEKRMAALESRMDLLENQINILESRIDAHEEKTEQNHQILLGKLEHINEQIGILAHDFISTKADIRILKKATGVLE